jgi:hypothetical protein
LNSSFFLSMIGIHFCEGHSVFCRRDEQEALPLPDSFPPHEKRRYYFAAVRRYPERCILRQNGLTVDINISIPKDRQKIK